jgi:hypothetical protein
LGRKLQPRRTRDSVQPLVAHCRGVAVHAIPQPLALLGSFGAAYLKNVREVRVKSDHQHKLHRLQPVVQQPNVLVAAGLSQKLRAENMHGTPRQQVVAILRRIHIGQINGQEGVVVPDRGAQQHWLLLIQSEGKPRKVPALGVEQPELRRA